MEYAFIDTDSRKELLRNALVEMEREHDRLRLSIVSNEASRAALQDQLDQLGE